MQASIIKTNIWKKTNSYLNFNGATLEVCECRSNVTHTYGHAYLGNQENDLHFNFVNTEYLLQIPPYQSISPAYPP